MLFVLLSYCHFQFLQLFANLTEVSFFLQIVPSAIRDMVAKLSLPAIVAPRQVASEVKGGGAKLRVLARWPESQRRAGVLLLSQVRATLSP